MSSWISPFKAVNILETLVEFAYTCKHLSDQQYRIELVKKFKDNSKLAFCLANPQDRSYSQIKTPTLLHEGQALVLMFNIQSTTLAVELLRIDYAVLLALLDSNRNKAEEDMMLNEFSYTKPYFNLDMCKDMVLGIFYDLTDDGYYQYRLSCFADDICMAAIEDYIDTPHVRQQLDRLASQLTDDPQQPPQQSQQPIIHEHGIENQFINFLSPSVLTWPNIDKTKHESRGRKRTPCDLYNPPSPSYSSNSSSGMSEESDSDNDSSSSASSVSSPLHRTPMSLGKRPYKRPRVDSVND